MFEDIFYIINWISEYLSEADDVPKGDQVLKVCLPGTGLGHLNEAGLDIHTQSSGPVLSVVHNQLLFNLYGINGQNLPPSIN